MQITEMERAAYIDGHLIEAACYALIDDLGDVCRTAAAEAENNAAIFTELEHEHADFAETIAAIQCLEDDAARNVLLVSWGYLNKD